MLPSKGKTTPLTSWIEEALFFSRKGGLGREKSLELRRFPAFRLNWYFGWQAQLLDAGVGKPEGTELELELGSRPSKRESIKWRIGKLNTGQ